MRINRTSAVVVVLGAIALGALAPAAAIVVPVPEPVETSAPSPAMSAGRAFCACSGLPYQPLWID